MELRSRHHFHFIQAIKGGSVEKVLNVDNRGRPAVRFRSMKDIHGDKNSDDTLPTFRPRLLFGGMQVDCGMNKPESPCSITMEKPDAYECDCEANERKTSMDDLSFSNMTLKQIKERCKGKKRKHSGDSSRETAKPSPCGKQEYPDFQPGDDESDFEELLSSYKMKLAKRKKGKKNMKSYPSTSPQAAIYMVKSEYIHADQDLATGDSPVPLCIKVEVSESDYPDCQGMTSASADLSLGCNEQLGSFTEGSIEVPETANGLESQASTSPTKQPQCCHVNKESYEFRDCVDPMSVFDVGVSGWEIIKVDSAEMPSQLPSVPETTIVLETEMSISPTKMPQCCSVDDASFEYVDYVDPESVYGNGVSGWEMIKVDDSEMTTQQYSELPISKFKEECHVIYALPYCVSPETPTRDNCDIHDAFQNFSSMKETSWETSHEIQIQAPDRTTVDRLQCLESCNLDGACLSEDGNKDDLPSAIDSQFSKFNSSVHPNSDSAPDSCSVSLNQDSPITEKQSLSLQCLDAIKEMSSVSQSYDASDGLATLPRLGDYLSMKLHHQPERLFSKRKAISPSSQEKLCKAMEKTELHDSKNSKCRGKLYFSQQSNHRILRTEGLDQIRKVEVPPNRKQINRRPKCNKQSAHPKSSPGVPHLSLSVPRLSTGCASIQSCSQSAIAFSQRQMHDVELLATKLTKDLESIKDIMKEALQTEASPARLSKQNMDTMSVAIENATRAEETARRWLSTMARDCSRFCKIMKLIQESSAASENVVPRERKITFADEAGGELCHVKFFGNDMASPLKCSNEKQDFLVE